MKKLNGNNLYRKEDFIWSMINYYFIQKKTNKVLELVESMYEFDIDFGSVCEDLMLKFIGTKDYKYLIRIFKKALSECLFSTEKQVILISYMFKSKEINLNEALGFINRLHPVEKNLPQKIQKVIDVAWLINEDEKDNRLSAGDDGMLTDALIKVVDD